MAAPEFYPTTHQLPSATLTFSSDWRLDQTGEIKIGGTLIIYYSERRLDDWLQDWRHWWMESFKACVRFHPGEQFYELELFTPPVIYHPPRLVPCEVRIPDDASWVEIWFQNSARDHMVYDSRFGQNYCFDVVSQ